MHTGWIDSVNSVKKESPVFTPNRKESLPHTCATPHVVFAVGFLFSLECLVVKSESSLPSLPEGLLPAPVAEAILIAEYNKR
jgi:hypothetical protein